MNKAYTLTERTFTEQKCVCFIKFLTILTYISRINEPIPGMFVLFWMHLPWWFQIWSWNSKMLPFFNLKKNVWPVVCTRLPRQALCVVNPRCHYFLNVSKIISDALVHYSVCKSGCVMCQSNPSNSVHLPYLDMRPWYKGSGKIEKWYHRQK